ncbi:minor tail protein [Mycobacterium phage Myxus]|uniref:Minor tail protein n=9 Tax=Fromanvirus TaxID=186764 RepID=A0A142K4U1_9CAUD|nr:minor tail protein [Mycobacterium phage Pioneer]YP_009301856.1 minor tail protein [Mycobacterium phage Catalina]YP_009636003.1 minor tail protein [Mycobacterium phage PackMan]AMO43901.1 minor tail protein [Mycobacterium phage Myxus]AMS00833.1 minor tail protein [Mycobacterium phage Eidsmoe]AOQ28990.1 minor tail protein [Mycobacterium phage HortumSL17]AOT26152.1 minor tail protein [Mycobacterium phage Qobbit]AOY12085.1 minor tail protein [Mycobacterium phage Phaeder]AVI03742.1 minor tail 
MTSALWPTNPLEAIGADGAFQIGGGDWGFGQNYTESVVRSLFQPTTPTPGNALALLEQQLAKMPLEVLKGFEGLIPGGSDAFSTVPKAVATIMGSLTDSVRAGLETVVTSMQTILNQILEILGGGIVTPINGAVQAVKDWWTALMGKTQHLGSDGKVNADLSQIPALQGLVDAATNALSGASTIGQEVVGAGLDAVKDTMENLFGMLTKVTRDVQQLQSEQETAANGGKRFNIDFSQYPDGEFPSGLFNLTYSGPGTSRLIIKNGHAQWSTVNNGYRRATMLYPEPTMTPQQIVRGTLASPPAQGTNVRIWSIARANAAGTDYVFARGYCTGFLSYKGDIGCVKNGVEYIWASGVSLTWSLDLRVVCGVGEDPRRHQVYSGTKVIWDGLEPGDKQSIIDDNHCWWGAISETDGNNTPGTVAGASVSDNAPPAVTGSTMRVYRSSTAASADKSSGEAVLPANALDAIDYRSSDITWNAATQTATVTKSGTYMMGLRVQTTSALGFSEERYPLIFINGVPRIKMAPTRGISVNGFGVPSTPQDYAFGGDGVSYYLPAGATVRPGLKSDGTLGIVGDANASSSWFAMARVG